MENWAVVIGLAAALTLFAALSQLRRRVQYLESQMSALRRHLGLAPPPLYSPSERVKQLAADPKRKIEAIKVFREESGLGLKEAKTIVEELIQSQGMNCLSATRGGAICEARHRSGGPWRDDVNLRLASAAISEDSLYMSHALPSELPLPLLERLRAEGVATLEAWVALGRRRRQIFGVTSAAVAQIDAFAKAALKVKR